MSYSLCVLENNKLVVIDIYEGLNEALAEREQFRKWVAVFSDMDLTNVYIVDEQGMTWGKSSLTLHDYKGAK